MPVEPPNRNYDALLAIGLLLIALALVMIAVP